MLFTSTISLISVEDIVPHDGVLELIRIGTSKALDQRLTVPDEVEGRDMNIWWMM
jgi:hypothetical protein